MKDMSDIEEGRRVLRIEAQSILDVSERLNGGFEKAVRMVLDCHGKVIVTGIGKSGQVARKMASTLSSTGTPSLYLHPAESSHGDLGLLSEGDIVVLAGMDSGQKGPRRSAETVTPQTPKSTAINSHRGTDLITGNCITIGRAFYSESK